MAGTTRLTSLPLSCGFRPENALVVQTQGSDRPRWRFPAVVERALSIAVVAGDDEIADRFKTSDEKIADSFDSASILFAHVVEFTPMSADMTS